MTQMVSIAFHDVCIWCQLASTVYNRLIYGFNSECSDNKNRESIEVFLFCLGMRQTYVHSNLSSILTYPINIFSTNISSSANKVFHCVLMAFFSCCMQWSPLMEFKSDSKMTDRYSKLLVFGQHKELQFWQSGGRVAEFPLMQEWL